jgi:hypothetical protein
VRNQTCEYILQVQHEAQPSSSILGLCKAVNVPAPSIDRSAALDDIAASIAKDLYLFDHYLDHACRILDSITIYGRKIGLPLLAAEN